MIFFSHLHGDYLILENKKMLLGLRFPGFNSEYEEEK
jgi:hypothetical protein